MIEEPIFLVGAERSGTTLMRLMLDSHPDVAFGEEFEFAVTHIEADGTFPPIADFERAMATDRIFGTSGFSIDPSLPYPELIDGFLRKRQEGKGAKFVGATIHFGFVKALRIWPDAKFIHMIRDPRDVARSSVEMGWAGNVWFGLDKWIEADDGRRELGELVPADRILDVGFDDLMADHVAVLDRICDFVGLTYTEQMLAYAASTDYDIPDPTRARDWRGDMSSLDVRMVETRLGDRLVEAGFEPSGLAPLPTNRIVDEALRMHSRLGRIRNRVAVYGLRLTAEEMWARLTGDEERLARVRTSLNDIELGRLKRSWSDGATGRSSR